MGRFVWNKRNKRNDHCSLTQEQQKCLLFLQRPTLHLHQCEPFEMVQLFVTPRSVHRILQARILEWVLWRTPILDLWRRSLLQGIFLTQRSNSGLLHCRQILYHLSYQGNPIWNGRICQKSRKITEAPPLPKPLPGNREEKNTYHRRFLIRNKELTSSHLPGFCRGQQEVSKRWETAVQRF